MQTADYVVFVTVPVSLLNKVVPIKLSGQRISKARNLERFILRYLEELPETPDMTKVFDGEKRSFTLRLSPEVYESFHTRAKKEGRQISNMLAVVLAALLND